MSISQMTMNLVPLTYLFFFLLSTTILLMDWCLIRNRNCLIFTGTWFQPPFFFWCGLCCSSFLFSVLFYFFHRSVSCAQCCGCLLTVHLWLPLTFIYSSEVIKWKTKTTDTITIIPKKLAEIMTKFISLSRIFMTAYFPVLVQTLQ